MAQPQLMQIKLSRFDAQPWGFRLQGGVDFAAPLLVQKVNGGSLAEQAGLMPGDAVIKINDVDVFSLRHKDAQDVVVRSGNNFVITIQRGGSTWRPHVTPTGQMPQPNSPYLQTVTKTSLAHKQPQDSQHIGCGYNNAAKPFGNGVDGNVKSIVNKQYNSPVGIYSDESIAETLSAQAEVLAGGVLGVNFKKNEKEYQAEKSEVLKFLREEESGQSTPAFTNNQYQESQQQQYQQQQQQQQYQQPQQQQQQYQQPQQQQHQQQHQHQHQHQQQQQYHQQQQSSTTRHVTAPVTQPKPPSTGGLPTGQNICVECERLITGVFVRIKDRNLHVECFKCATCGTSLKNQGYYNFNNKLYCDIHAKLAAMQNPPAGTEGYVPVPMKPNTKLSATTISSALSAHGFNNGVSNGSSPAPAPQEENISDLPLPPPPSPTQLQQYELNNQQPEQQHTRTLSSLSSMSTGSNTTHSSTQSLSPTPYNYQQHHPQQHHLQQQLLPNYQQQQSETTNSSLSLDQYGTSSPLHSRQASSSSSSLNYGSMSGSENYVTIATPPLPPPPPPMPEDNNQDLYINTMKQQHNTNNRKLMTKQNENDMNKYNEKSSATTPATTIGGGGVVGGNPPVVPTTQKVYNKFLKEYSNKLLTQNNNNNNTTNNTTNNNSMKQHSENNNQINSYINNGSPKPFIVSQHQQQHKAPIQQHYNHHHSQQHQYNNNNNNSINNSSLPSVAALTATLNNQLKFDSCQVAPPPTPACISNLPIVDKSLSNSNIISSNNNNTNNNSSSNLTNDMSSTMASLPPNVSEQSSSIYGQINTTSATPASGDDGGDKPFEYVTLTGNVIRSVVPPGRGNVNYKVNQGGYARPYGAAPPAAAPKSPVSYPPQQQQWNQPPPTQPKPAGGNAYATLPRSNVGQQGRKTQSMYNNYSSNYSSTQQQQYSKKSPSIVGPNRYSTMPSSLNTTSYNNYNNYYNQEEASEESLQPQYAETYFEEDYEVEQANRQQRMNFCWPPTHDDSHRTPTAAPLYIPPPETQHIVAKPIENPPPPPPGNVQQQQHQQQQQCQQCEYAEEVVQQLQQQQHQQQQQAQWQSRSAPQLTVQQQQQLECESGSDSYTSTSTTTTTTSEEYQRMYAAQVQAYQMQQAFEQSGSELDYNMDMEVAAMQQQERLQLCSSEYMESGRRSAQECRDALAPPLSTYKLVDMVREVTPSPVPRDNQGSRHVVFLEDTDVKEIVDQQQEIQGKQEEQLHLETQESSYVEEREEEYQEEGFIRDDRSHILESERIFQPTPEIKFEIAPVKQIPPTKIPNPCPKEWINPMVRVLTTAPETPFHMVNCLCPKPCDDCCCQLQPEVEVAKEIPEEPPKEPIPEPYERPLSPTPEPEPVEINTIWNTPTLSKAMTIAPDFELKFVPPASECIPLPEETEPYMPPPIVVKPFVREDYRPKTPLLRALTTAPEKPFEGQFDGDVPIHVLDLPTPKETLTMSDALRTAPERPYTPLNPENAMLKAEEQKQEEEKKKYEFQVLDKEEELGLSKEALEQVEYYTTEKRKSSTSAFAAMQAFQPSSQPLSSNTTTTPRHSLTYTKGENDLEYRKYHDAHERYQKRRSFFSQKEQELQQQQLQEQTNTTSQQQHQQQTREESSLYSSTKASSSTSNTSSAVQQQQQTLTSSYASNLTQASKSCYSSAYENADSCVTSKKLDVHEIIEEVAEELEHSEVLFPPPSPLSHLKQHKPSSGLHKPESIPKYQRNWTVLPTQSPIRTPEPQELRENVPLAFVDTPKTPCNTNETYGNTVHKPVARTSQQQSTATAYSSAITSSQTEQRQQQHSTITSSSSVTASSSAAKHQQLQITKPTIPIIIEDRSGPVTMAFQALDEHMVRDQSQTPSRPYTPSMINKPAPITPYYQTPEKLCFYEEAAPHARAYDRRSASPFPDRARSPAPGPPPNPLAAIRAPRIKDTEASSSLAPRNLQAGSITTGQSYLGAQQAQQQERLLSHTSTAMQSAMHSYTEEPEKRQELQIGNMTMQRSEKASHLEEQKQSQMQSHTTSQVGNTQIERRRKVTEEFEHTSSAKTVEIRTGSQSSSERRQSYGKTGYVANQARRLSGLEQEITDLTSQAQAITARAATMTDTKFPEFHSQGGQAKFPTKPVFPHDDEPQAACPYVSSAVNKKLVDPCYQYQQNRKKSVSPMYGASLLQLQKQQQQQQQQQQKSLTTISSSQQHQQQANTVSSSLTKANATSTTNNQAYQSITAGSSNLNATSTTTSAIATSSPSSLSTNAGAAPASGVCPVTGTFCRPGHTCCKQQQLQTSTKNNNGFRPTASLGSAAGVKPPHAPASNIIANTQAQATAAPIAPAPTASTTPSVSSNNNNKNDDSNSGGMAPKGGAYGATSAPKRGRGILNKAAAPGVRVPLCNSCSTQIRGPFITALGKIWCPEHFHCFNGNCRRPLQDIGFVEEKGDLYCEYCFEKYLAPTCSKCAGKIKGDCLNAIGKHFHPECFSCGHCGKLFGNTPFFLEDGMPYCEADWNELFTTKCFACGFPVEAGDRWVEALNHNYHSQCFNCTYCKQNLEGQSFYNKGGRPFCKNHAR